MKLILTQQIKVSQILLKHSYSFSLYLGKTHYSRLGTVVGQHLEKLFVVISTIDNLSNKIKTSRSRIIELTNDISPGQSSIKTGPDKWNIQEVIEHLVLAERGGFNLIYTAAEKFRIGEPVWTGKSKNEGLSIEEIIMNTWKPKEKAPESAMPVGKWSLGVWLSHFQNCDDLLKNLNVILKDLPLHKVIYPHFLCGPLDVIQRLEFIRFHIDHHQSQIIEIKKVFG